ncbi:hypothetical protein [Fibrisoma montanum]|uniref:hypothetical protein n=1 Tax=Fibrisoma montanum TaxID=2305895 RepID=UPI0011C21354|nr:hypothetical protein [Fibrisoma montanum]
MSGSTTGSIKTTFDTGNDVLMVTKSSDSNDVYLSFTKSRFTTTLDKNGAFFLPPQAEQAYAVMVRHLVLIMAVAERLQIMA